MSVASAMGYQECTYYLGIDIWSASLSKGCRPM